ncbi:MAG: EamA family transporter, partial [Bacillota bacterium]|nr:EamA family transporter [Bacillota bacterium]
SSVITAIPAPYTFKLTGHISFLAIFSLIALGFITGISFYINGIVLKRIPLLAAGLVSNSSVIFTLLWAWIFFREPINIHIILGSVTFVAGIILINIPRKIRVTNAI